MCNYPVRVIAAGRPRKAHVTCPYHHHMLEDHFTLNFYLHPARHSLRHRSRCRLHSHCHLLFARRDQCVLLAEKRPPAQAHQVRDLCCHRWHCGGLSCDRVHTRSAVELYRVHHADGDCHTGLLYRVLADLPEQAANVTHPSACLLSVWVDNLPFRIIKLKDEIVN